MKLFQKIYDLTVPLKEGVINYPGDPPFKMKELSAIDAGNPFELNKISMSTHTGTCRALHPYCNCGRFSGNAENTSQTFGKIGITS